MVIIKKQEVKMMRKSFLSLIIVVIIFGLLPLKAEIELVGAGATFPYPLYSKMFAEYYKQYGVKVNYQAIGSGGGIRQLMARTVDFGASDAYVDDKGIKKFPAPIVHIPIVAGAVVIIYNLPIDSHLKLSPEVLADIFLGRIRKWNDEKIRKLNPDIELPNKDIVVIHRSDGSGTTFIFSDYLCKVSSEWQKKVGRGKFLNWPVGLGAKGNPGVAGLVRQIPGAIGYVELIYAKSNDIPFASVKNKKGNFIVPSLESVTLAADVPLPDDMRVSLTNTDSKYGYPIAGFTWILVYKDLANCGMSREKAKALVDLLWWMVHNGQKYATPMHYAPLLEKAQRKAEAIIKSIEFEGEALIK